MRMDNLSDVHVFLSFILPAMTPGVDGRTSPPSPPLPGNITIFMMITLDLTMCNSPQKSGPDPRTLREESPVIRHCVKWWKQPVKWGYLPFQYVRARLLS